MRKLISAIVTLCCIGLTSCNKEGTSDERTSATGNVRLTIGFTAPGAETQSGQSSAKPVTSWKKNVQALQMLLVNPSNNKVVYAHDVSLSAMTGTGFERTTALIPNVPAGTHDLYLIANNRTTSAVTLYPDAYAGTDDPIIKGADISQVLFKLKAAADPSNTTPGAKPIGQPGEIFWAKKGAIVISPDTDNDIKDLDLKRAVGLLRVRINKSHENVRDVAFAGADATGAGFRVRNVSDGFTVSTKAPNAATAANTIVALGGFRNATNYTELLTAGEYADGGTNGIGVVADANNVDDFTYWKDYLCLAGGANMGSGRFEIVISGWAKAGYRLADGTKLAAPALVYWTGPVDKPLSENGILEMNVTITSPGIGGPGVPEPGSFGNLKVTTTLIEWGAIDSVEVPL